MIVCLPNHHGAQFVYIFDWNNCENISTRMGFSLVGYILCDLCVPNIAYIFSLKKPTVKSGSEFFINTFCGGFDREMV